MESGTILEKLKERGHRMTKVRRSLIEIFGKSKVPLAVAECMSALKRRGMPVNKTTVYRELEFLMKEKLVREVDLLDRKKRYELLHEGDHHHHMICTECEAIQCIDMHHDLDALEESIHSRFQFKVTSHSLEFFGLCAKCQSL